MNNSAWSVRDYELGGISINWVKNHGMTRKVAVNKNTGKKVIIDYYKCEGLPNGYKMGPWYLNMWGDPEFEIPIRFGAGIALTFLIVLAILFYIPTLGWSWKLVDKCLGEE
jgi:hypothetical protein